MNIHDELRIIIGAYYGVREIDEYDLKVYILKEIENYQKDFVETNEINDFDFEKEKEIIEKKPLRRLLQDSLLILNKIDGPLELKLLIKKRINSLQKNKE